MKHLTIGNQWINSLLRAFQKVGLDNHEITKGLPSFVAGNLLPNSRVELSDARTMWHRAVQIAQDPLLGIKVGFTQDYRSVGVLAPVIWHSQNAKQALLNIMRYQKLISESGLYRIKEKGQSLQLDYLVSDSRVPAHPQQILAVVTSTVGALSEISNGLVTPQAIVLPEGLEAAAIGQQLGSQNISIGKQFSVDFDVASLESDIAGCDLHLYEINKAYAEEMLRSKNEGLLVIEEIKRFITQNGYSTASLAQFEALTQVSKRTVQRNLKEQATCFRNIKEELLKELAVRYLSDKTMSIEDIAKQLNYSEPSAFHRAFKGWFSETPMLFRRSV